MDEAGNHHSQQTNTGAENQTHVLTHKWELNHENTWTQGEQHYTMGPVEGWGIGGGFTLGEIPNVDDRLMDAANHRGMCILKNKKKMDRNLSLYSCHLFVIALASEKLQNN